jgi:hypothetical protein
MSREKSHLTPLETRKQMLLAESELNRIQFLHEWNELKGEIRRVTDPLKTAGAFISLAAETGTVLSILRPIFRRKNEAGEEKSWVSDLLDGAKAGISLWKVFRSGGRQP